MRTNCLHTPHAHMYTAKELPHFCAHKYRDCVQSAERMFVRIYLMCCNQGYGVHRGRVRCNEQVHRHKALPLLPQSSGELEAALCLSYNCIMNVLV